MGRVSGDPTVYGRADRWRESIELDCVEISGGHYLNRRCADAGDPIAEKVPFLRAKQRNHSIRHTGTETGEGMKDILGARDWPFRQLPLTTQGCRTAELSLILSDDEKEISTPPVHVRLE